jgi:hypothetical protein
MEELIEWAKKYKDTHPEKFYEIWGFISLCQDEIEEGGSPQHEIELCKESIRQLVNELE